MIKHKFLDKYKCKLGIHMLNQLMITMTLLCGYFTTIILINFNGITEEINVFLCSIILSALFVLTQLQRVFYWVSVLFLFALAILIQEFHLGMWAVSGLALGYILAPCIMLLQPNLKWYRLNQSSTAQRLKKHLTQSSFNIQKSLITSKHDVNVRTKRDNF